MFELPRTQRMSLVFYIVSIISLIIAIVSFAKGGAELVRGTIALDYLLSSILMWVFAATALLSFLLALSLSSLSKDITEKLTHIYEKSQNK